MRVQLIFEGQEAALSIEAEGAEDRALLKAFALDGELVATARVADFWTEQPSYRAEREAQRIRVVVQRKPPPEPTGEPVPMPGKP